MNYQTNTIVLDCVRVEEITQSPSSWMLDRPRIRPTCSLSRGEVLADEKAHRTEFRWFERG